MRVSSIDHPNMLQSIYLLKSLPGCHTRYKVIIEFWPFLLEHLLKRLYLYWGLCHIFSKQIDESIVMRLLCRSVLCLLLCIAIDAQVTWICCLSDHRFWCSLSCWMISHCSLNLKHLLKQLIVSMNWLWIDINSFRYLFGYVFAYFLKSLSLIFKIFFCFTK